MWQVCVRGLSVRGQGGHMPREEVLCALTRVFNTDEDYVPYLAGKCLLERSKVGTFGDPFSPQHQMHRYHYIPLFRILQAP